MASFKTKKIHKTPEHIHHSASFQKKLITPISQEISPQNHEHHEVFVSKKRRNRIRFFAGILLILSVLAFFGVWGLQAIGNMSISKDTIEAKLFNPIISLIENEKEEKAPNEKGSKNILIAGIGGMGHPGGELTDSLMLANLNYDTQTVTLLSIPRDLYVAHSSNTAGKINALYPMGKGRGEGVNLLAKKVSEITGQPIHHFMIIDFSGFKSIVNTLGGVEVDVPARIYDREYPNNNWGYEIFSLEKGLQTLDGNTALKFARSRHSTSDFDRSHRQQLLLRAIKDKVLSLGIITNPQKIGDLIDSVRSHISTDLTVGQLVDIGMHFKDMKNENIVMYSYNDQCISNCLPGSYLYTPVREAFGGAWVLLPETATKSRLSRYDEMQKFATLIFKNPHLQNADTSIRIITNSKNLSHARNIRKNLEQLGFPINHSEVIVQTGATISHSSVHSFYDKNTESGFSENHTIIQALKQIEKNIQFSFDNSQKYTSGTGAYIEIILGNDAKNYFSFSTPATPIAPSKKPETPTRTQTGNTSKEVKEKTVTHNESTEKQEVKAGTGDDIFMPLPSTQPNIELPSSQEESLF